VDLQRFRPAAERDLKWRDRFGLPGDSIVFGQVSSLIHRKGVDVLLRGFRIVKNQCPEARLILIGDGPQTAEYLAMARDLGLENHVVFAGNQLDPVPFYQNVLDVNVLASRSDAFPLSLLEASGCGLPNIGANVDGIGESVFDGETGFLFESGSHEALADKMRALVVDPELRRQFGHLGRATAVEKFGLQQYCESIEKIILDEIAYKHRVHTPVELQHCSASKPSESVKPADTV
jgi:glycosyltransferase involved in cell wall biosynthesis